MGMSFGIDGLTIKYDTGIEKVIEHFAGFTYLIVLCVVWIGRIDGGMGRGA
jgi:hypothetical protein